MWTVRAVNIDDLDALLHLVQSATRGLTSLQLDRARLLDRIEQSVLCLSSRRFVAKGRALCAGADEHRNGRVGWDFHCVCEDGWLPADVCVSDRRDSDHHSDQLGISHHRERLELQRIHDGPTEIGSLFLRGIYRGEGRGRWLSLSRFALIAMLPHRFADRVIAQLRGKADSDGSLPFWDAVPGKFIPTTFPTADAMSTISKQFIEEMMPQYPIYLDLLPERIRQAIGDVHDESVPALKLLQREGFVDTDLVDIFDAGPVIHCETQQIKAVKRCQPHRVARVVDKAGEQWDSLMLASPEQGFTSVVGPAQIEGDSIVIRAADARQLQVETGSSCHVLSLRPDQP